MLLNMTVCGKAIHPIAGFADVLFGNPEVTPPGYHQSRTAFLVFPLPIISTCLFIFETWRRYSGANYLKQAGPAAANANQSGLQIPKMIPKLNL
jgi:hypothetical protein